MNMKRAKRDTVARYFATADHVDDKLLDYNPALAKVTLTDAEHDAVRARVRGGDVPQPLPDAIDLAGMARMALATTLSTAGLVILGAMVVTVVGGDLAMPLVFGSFTLIAGMVFIFAPSNVMRAEPGEGLYGAVYTRTPSTSQGDAAGAQDRVARRVAATIRGSSAWASGDLSRHHLALDLDDLLATIRRRAHAVLDIEDLLDPALPKTDRVALADRMEMVVTSTGTLLEALVRYEEEALALSAQIDALRALEKVESRLGGILDAVAETAGDRYRVEDIERRTAEISARREALAVLRVEIEGFGAAALAD